MDKVIESFDIKEIIRYLIAGFWTSEFYSLIYHQRHLEGDARTVFLSLCVGVLVYHGFRSTVFPVITWLGDKKAWGCYDNARRILATESGKKLTFGLWVELNDRLRIKRMKNEAMKDDGYEYDRWLSSIILLYIAGLTPILLTILRGDWCQNWKYPLIGLAMIGPAFFSQRFYETRLLAHWRYAEEIPNVTKEGE